MVLALIHLKVVAVVLFVSQFFITLYFSVAHTHHHFLKSLSHVHPFMISLSPILPLFILAG